MKIKTSHSVVNPPAHPRESMKYFERIGTRLVQGIVVVWICSAAAQGMVPRRENEISTVFYDDNTPVRVLLTRGIQRLRLRGSARILDSDQQVLITPAGESFSVFLNRGQVWVSSGEGLRFRTIAMVPPLSLAPPSPSDSFVLDGKRYRGTLTLEKMDRGLMVINRLPMKEYLLGTVASEMPASWPLEALTAQTVAARTYAFERLSSRRQHLFDLESTTKDQVYTGVPTKTSRVLRAIQSTAGQFLGESGKPMRAYYHARCGGYSDHPKSIWGRTATPGSAIACPYCLKSRHSWRASVPRTELIKLLELPRRLASMFRLEETSRTPGGRIKTLRGGSPENSVVLDAEKLRSLIGYTKLKSTRFRWKTDRGSIRFEGAGEGHGVGLCQWGARGLADGGADYREILRHYYPDWTLYRTAQKNSRVIAVPVLEPLRASKRTRLSTPRRADRETSDRTAG